MANFEKQQCKECIGNTICDDVTLVGGMACKKFALKLAEALKPSHNLGSTKCPCRISGVDTSHGGCTGYIDIDPRCSVHGHFARA